MLFQSLFLVLAVSPLLVCATKHSPKYDLPLLLKARNAILEEFFLCFLARLARRDQQDRTLEENPLQHNG